MSRPSLRSMGVIVIASGAKRALVACSARGWSFAQKDSDLPKGSRSSIAHLSGCKAGFVPPVVPLWLLFMTKILRL